MKTIKAKSDGQAELMSAIDRSSLVMALGPAGTGKTYLAIAKAVEALEAGKAGAVVGPVQGPGGWYLLRAEDLQETRVAPFAGVRDDIVKELTRRDRFQALEKWLDAARERASVTRP